MRGTGMGMEGGTEGGRVGRGEIGTFGEDYLPLCLFCEQWVL